ncbi:MAG: hypothetical protein HC793_00525 [Aquincola sp.]|nr:hypothetical protein [Aquincola sp.]
MAGIAWDALAKQLAPACSVTDQGQQWLRVTVGELVAAGLLRVTLMMLQRLDNAKAWISWTDPVLGFMGTRSPVIAAAGTPAASALEAMV